MFPWVCFKCGHMASGVASLVLHIEATGHRLTSADTATLLAAEAQVKKVLETK